jgi:hypothetical protein
MANGLNLGRADSPSGERAQNRLQLQRNCRDCPRAEVDDQGLRCLTGLGRLGQDSSRTLKEAEEHSTEVQVKKTLRDLADLVLNAEQEPDALVAAIVEWIAR